VDVSEVSRVRHLGGVLWCAEEFGALERFFDDGFKKSLNVFLSLGEIFLLEVGYDRLG